MDTENKLQRVFEEINKNDIKMGKAEFLDCISKEIENSKDAKTAVVLADNIYHLANSEYDEYFYDVIGYIEKNGDVEAANALVENIYLIETGNTVKINEGKKTMGDFTRVGEYLKKRGKERLVDDLNYANKIELEVPELEKQQKRLDAILKLIEAKSDRDTANKLLEVSLFFDQANMDILQRNYKNEDETQKEIFQEIKDRLKIRTCANRMLNKLPWSEEQIRDYKKLSSSNWKVSGK